MRWYPLGQPQRWFTEPNIGRHVASSVEPLTVHTFSPVLVRQPAEAVKI